MIPSMIPAWVAVAAWLVAWIALALFSLDFLGKVRPGERAPMMLKADGSAAWFVSPVVAAALTPLLSVIAGGVTIGAAYLFSEGRAPIMNAVLAGVFVFTHFVHMRRATAWLEKQRG